MKSGLFDLKNIIHLYDTMQEKGVVIYGAGKNGKLVFKTLQNEGIEVLAVADKQNGKCLCDMTSISLEELCNRECKEVCIVTPNIEMVTDEIELLKRKYPLVLNSDDIGKVIEWLIHWCPHFDEKMNYIGCHPFNHYESPYASEIEISNNKRFMKDDKLMDIDLNLDSQKLLMSKLLDKGNEFMKLYRLNAKEFRYRLDNSWFSDSDAVLLHTIMREYNPKRIIEVGSGYSSCMMLDTNEVWLDNQVDITCIEPFPDRLYNNIKSTDTLKIKTDFIQNINLNEFENLKENDILFIDSSHVAKAGGDIPYEYFEILPRLKNGVLIHIHDIFSTFSYPTEWLYQSRAYNEGFVLRALLMNNARYKIIYFNNMMEKLYSNEYMKIDGFRPDTIELGSSMWLKVCSKNEGDNK